MMNFTAAQAVTGLAPRMEASMARMEVPHSHSSFQFLSSASFIVYSLIIHRWSIKQHLHLGKFRYKIATFSPSTAPAPSLKEARERLKQDSMTKDELAA